MATWFRAAGGRLLRFRANPRSGSGRLFARARMSGVVDLGQVLEVQVRVHLRGGDARVPQQFLHRAQISPFRQTAQLTDAEIGRVYEGDFQRLIVADEISPDSCRLWDIETGRKLDKDVFRQDLGNLADAYTEVARRLGVMPRTNGRATGPKLVN